jgi:DnaK suppressor protein
MKSQNTLLRIASRLIARRDMLRQMLDGDLDCFGKSSEVHGVGDNIDAAVDAANDEICSQLVQLESRELGRIEHALERIASGSYGRCEVCGGRISAARLNAMPYACSCINCQREQERRGTSSVMGSASDHWERVDELTMAEGESDEPGDFSELERYMSASDCYSFGDYLVTVSSLRN